MSELETDIWDREYPSEEEIQEQEQAFYSNQPMSANEYVQKEDYYEDDGVYDELIEEIEEEDDTQDSLLKNAQIRLEQGRLYKMLIEHNLFDGVDAEPEAISNVQSELKTFIMERLEVLLGIRAENKPEEHHVVESPFNDIEVEVLKRVANKMSKGFTSQVDQIETRKPQSNNQLNTMGGKQVKQNKLNSFVNKKKVKKTPPPQRALQSKKTPLPTNTGKTQKKDKRVEKIKVSSSDIMGAAKKDHEYVESLKGKSLEEANKIVSERHKRRTPKKEIDQKVINSHYQHQIRQNKTAQNFNILLQAAANNNK